MLQAAIKLSALLLVTSLIAGERGRVSAPSNTSRAAAGIIRGSVDQPSLMTAVTAINRENDKKYPGKVDPKSGQFIIENLPLSTTYDCLIDFGGAWLEGVNLKVPRSDYEEEQPLSKDDISALKASVASLNQFEDKVEVLAIDGNIQHAAVLVNKLRTRPFINSQPGEIVWRLELWRFEKPDETWIKVQDELFLVLYRERIQKTVFEKKSLTLDARLGGLQLTQDKKAVDLGMIRLPAKEAGIRFRTQEARK
jgi:hypothetical protein